MYLSLLTCISIECGLEEDLLVLHLLLRFAEDWTLRILIAVVWIFEAFWENLVSAGRSQMSPCLRTSQFFAVWRLDLDLMPLASGPGLEGLLGLSRLIRIGEGCRGMLRFLLGMGR